MPGSYSTPPGLAPGFWPFQEKESLRVLVVEQDKATKVDKVREMWLKAEARTCEIVSFLDPSQGLAGGLVGGFRSKYCDPQMTPFPHG